jgi:DDE_Tnp_1-associated/Transposase DDE domain
MPSAGPATFHHHFRDLDDPRVERTRIHPLINSAFIAVCGILSGADSCAAIPEFGRDRRIWRARFLDLSHGIPSEGTFRRVLARLDPAAVEKAPWSAMQAARERTASRLIASDGPTPRGSSNRRDGQAAIQMVSAWATENKLSLGPVVVDEKSHEITALPALLEWLELSEAVVTIDARGCQQEIAATIRARGGDSVLAVKRNPPTL